MSLPEGVLAALEGPGASTVARWVARHAASAVLVEADDLGDESPTLIGDGDAPTYALLDARGALLGYASRHGTWFGPAASNPTGPRGAVGGRRDRP